MKRAVSGHEFEKSDGDSDSGGERSKDGEGSNKTR